MDDDIPLTHGSVGFDGLRVFQPETSRRREVSKPTILASPFVYRDPASFPRREWIYARHLIRKYISCTVAPAGIGKTSLLLVEAVAMATGRNLLGKPIHGGPFRVWFICLEDPLEELQRRVLAILLHYRIDPAELGGRLFLDSGRTVKVVMASTTRNGTEIAKPVVEALKAEIKAKRIDVVVIDPLVKAHRVPENDNGAVDLVCSLFAEIADKTNCCFDLVHHVRKSNGGEITVEDGRGAVALLGAVGSARVLNPMSKDEAESAGGITARSFFRDTNGKLNLAPPVEKSDWYQLRSVSLGNGSGGAFDDGDFVGVAEPWEWPDFTETVTLAHLRAVQATVGRGGTWRENIQAKDWIGLVVAQAMNLDPKRKTDKQTIKAALAMWLGSGALVRTQRADKNYEMKTFIEVGEPAT